MKPIYRMASSLLFLPFIFTPALASPAAQPNNAVDSSKAVHAEKPSSAQSADVNSGLSAQGTEWLLPFDGQMASLNAPYTLHGAISNIDLDNELGQKVDELLDAALTKNPKTKNLDRAVAHYRSHTATTLSNSTDALNEFVHYRGFSASIEAGDVILDEKIKIKSRASAEYAKQRYVDEMHPKIVANVMQIAMGMGMSDKVRGAQIISDGQKSLKELVGEEEANQTVNAIRDWGRRLKVPAIVYKQTPWDVAAYQSKVETTIRLAMTGDPVVKDITNRVHKYNHRSKASRATSKLVEGGLGLASWAAPGFAIPVLLGVAEVGYVMGTGGPEENKLLKEMYFDKRLESRWRTVNAETQLALTHYQLAVANHNPMLLACSESVLAQLVGGDAMSGVLGYSVIAHKGNTEPAAVQTASSPSSIN